MNNNKQKLQQNYIIPFAKPTGVTSFKSMHSVKKVLGTKKVGHTGTLDLFADGLLVLLSGQYTRFAELISAGEKEYRAWLEFGKQTDTLDPEGELCLKKALPNFTDLEKSVKSFLGKQEQIPPKFSAIKIKGKRASDRIRAGEKLEMKARPIEIFDIEITQVITKEGRKLAGNLEGGVNKSNIETYTDEKIRFAELRVRCSKGTYIRSLSRDIAEKAGSCAYLRALRRTAVGHFKLEDAAGYSALEDFSKLGDKFIFEKNHTPDNNEKEPSDLAQDLFSKAKVFNTELAAALGIPSLILDNKYLFDFQHGKAIRKNWFLLPDNNQNENLNFDEETSYAVFHNGLCIGLITKDNNRFKYQLVFNN